MPVAPVTKITVGYGLRLLVCVLRLLPGFSKGQVIIDPMNRYQPQFLQFNSPHLYSYQINGGVTTPNSLPRGQLLNLPQQSTSSYATSSPEVEQIAKIERDRMLEKDLTVGEMYKKCSELLVRQRPYINVFDKRRLKLKIITIGPIFK